MGRSLGIRVPGLALALRLYFLLVTPAAAAPPIFSEIKFLPGDTEVAAAVDDQDWIEIAPGKVLWRELAGG